jgi:hypothetical protein
VIVVVFLLTLIASLNSWSASSKQRPTPNYLPSGTCNFKSKSFLVPKTNIRVWQFEVFTLQRGTGCLKGQTNALWNRCDLRNGETESGSEPIINVILRLRNPDTLKNTDIITIPMTEIVQLGWVTDRNGNPTSIIETTKRANIEIAGSLVHLVAKRTIKKLDEDKVMTELLFYSPADALKKVRPKLLYQARCESEITRKSY